MFLFWNISHQVVMMFGLIGLFLSLSYLNTTLHQLFLLIFFVLSLYFSHLNSPLDQPRVDLLLVKREEGEVVKVQHLTVRGPILDTFHSTLK